MSSILRLQMFEAQNKKAPADPVALSKALGEGLGRLLEAIAGRLSPEGEEEIRGFCEVGEWGLAFDAVLWYAERAGVAFSPAQREEILDLADKMERDPSEINQQLAAFSV